MRGQIKVFVLAALLRWEKPMTKSAIVSSVQRAMGPQALVSDIVSCLAELVTLGLLMQAHDLVVGELVYGLTTKGEMEAKQHE